jgi:hypothetical protein
MKPHPIVWTLAAVFVGALTLGGALPMQAQDVKPQPQQPPPPPAFSQQQLESFVAAALQVREIRTRWQPRIQEAESAEKAQEFQKQGTAEMVRAIEARGLTVETFNAIATAARNNPDLASRLTKLMEAAPR